MTNSRACWSFKCQKHGINAFHHLWHNAMFFQWLQPTIQIRNGSVKFHQCHFSLPKKSQIRKIAANWDNKRLLKSDWQKVLPANFNSVFGRCAAIEVFPFYCSQMGAECLVNDDLEISIAMIMGCLLLQVNSKAHTQTFYWNVQREDTDDLWRTKFSGIYF